MRIALHERCQTAAMLATSPRRWQLCGDLDRITAWLRVFAMVNVAPGFNETPRVTNGYSDLILELYGPEAGQHARSSIGMMIPLNAPVNCEAEVEIDGVN